jgi:hypothetical protein
MRKSTALQKELKDDATLLKRWRAWHAELRAEALAGPFGALVEQLLEILRGLRLQDSALLLAFIRSQRWSEVDMNVRLECLHQINARMTRLREQAGLVPFDDALPDKPTTGFLIVRQLMLGT